MRYFKEMVKCVRETGVGSYHGGRQDWLATNFFDLAPLNEVFVFTRTMNVHGPEDLPDYVFEPMDAPFPVFSIELTDGPITSSDGDPGAVVRNAEIYCILVAEFEALARAAFKDPAIKVPDDFKHITGDKILTFSYVRSTQFDGTYRYHVVYLAVGRDTNTKMYDLIRVYLDRLQVEKDGMEEVPDVVMLPAGKGGRKKKPHAIRRVFHIMPKSRARTYSAPSGRTIDWTHRWVVRGHWVRLADANRVGKNRAGDYVERGRTWRNQHEKGPEDAPIVKKTRIVHTE